MATIPIFDGTNYEFWSVKMKTLLLSKGLLVTLQDGYNHVANERQDAEALSHIQQGVSDRIFPEIRNATTARQAWDIPFQRQPTWPGYRNVITPKELKQTGANHLIVATLIATVAFTAGFSMPGGYNGDNGPNQGMAILTRKEAFKIFMVTDTMAMSLSISAVLLHFLAAFTNNRDEVKKLVYIAAYLIIYAAIAMVMAFVSGIRAVLAHSPGLEISVFVIGLLPLSVFLFTNIVQKVTRALIRY